MMQGDDFGRGGEPALLIHPHALVVARPQAVALHPVLGHARAQLQRLQLLLVGRMVPPARQLQSVTPGATINAGEVSVWCNRSVCRTSAPSPS